ncbi:MAG TPA: dTDP-4-dehydrorhamnose 3,5-epimerase [Mailhella massiliensis]|uniref:dTDP-4-dehydrorhamnose 3,5-epimerase n=1 Tax=Mailhella massiliensis TaxID=1903261 RepID=A0A921AXV0_9BACT|nr:dTDP-4-dehydrorhamnose 3,5-epimerase [Mailhella massiliensis]
MDIRRASPACGRHAAVELSAGNRLRLMIPRGFAQGFSVPGGEAAFACKCGKRCCKEPEGGIRSDEPAAGRRIDKARALTAAKGKACPYVSGFESCFRRRGAEAGRKTCRRAGEQVPESGTRAAGRCESAERRSRGEEGTFHESADSGRRSGNAPRRRDLHTPETHGGDRGQAHSLAYHEDILALRFS